MIINVTARSSTYPLSDNEIEQHLRRDSAGAEADALALYKGAALDIVESYLRRPVMSTTYDVRFDDFPCDDGSEYPYGVRRGPVALPFYPIIGSPTVTYVDTDGNVQTLNSSEYVVSAGLSTPPELTPISGGAWPLTQIDRADSLRVAFSAGYTNASDVPKQLKAGILLTLHDLYTFRGSQITGTISSELPQNAERVLSAYVNRFIW